MLDICSSRWFWGMFYSSMESPTVLYRFLSSCSGAILTCVSGSAYHFTVTWADRCCQLSRFRVMPWRWWDNEGPCGLSCGSVRVSWQSPAIGCWMCAAVHVKANPFWGFLIIVVEVKKEEKHSQINKYIPGIWSCSDVLQQRVPIWNSSCN